jgi:hypothetical protein
MAFPWIMTSILITLIVIFAGIAMDAKKKKKPMTYKNYFYMGLGWLVTGLVLGVVYPLLMGYPLEEFIYMNGLTSMGMVFTIVGLANRDKWNEKVPQPFGKHNKLAIALAGLTILLVILTALFVRV